MLRSLTVRAAQAAVLVGLVAGAGAYTTLDSTVTVSVDGAQTSVRTFSDDVAGVLASAGLEVGPHDVVTPALDADVPESGTIVLDRGRPVELTVDGSTRTVWVTARSVGELLGDLGLRTDGAVVSADRSTRIPVAGMDLSLRLPFGVSVTADGATRELTTTATTVADLLAEAGVVPGPTDLVSPDPASVPAAGTAVTVVRVQTLLEESAVAEGFTTSRVADAAMTVGTERVEAEGAEGRRVRTVERVLHDGVEVSRRTVVDTVTVAPTTRVVRFGTKAKPAPAPAAKPAPRPAPAPAPAPAPRRATSDVDSLNWPALARCESGGNPRAENPNGYYGLYQFSMGTWRGVGGSGKPSDASPDEQTYRAKLLFQRQGDSPWPHCGSRLYS